MSILICLIIVLVLLLVLVGIIYYAYHRISTKVRSFSQMAFGTSSLMKGLEQVEADYATTPKSVSGATSMYLPRIMKDFPDFHYDEMKRRAENVLMSYLRSIDSDNVSLLTEGTEELKEQLSMHIDMLHSQGEMAHYSQMKLHRTEIYQYRKQKGRCSVVFQSALEYKYYREKNGKVTAGSRDRKTQSRYNVECIYIQDRDMIEDEKDMALVMNCPNCNAPLSGTGARVCEYCGTPIVEFNIYTWNFSDVKEI